MFQLVQVQGALYITLTRDPEVMLVECGLDLPLGALLLVQLHLLVVLGQGHGVAWKEGGREGVKLMNNSRGKLIEGDMKASHTDQKRSGNRKKNA